MKGKKWIPYLVFPVLTLALGGLASFWVTKGLPAYDQLTKPPLSPPNWLFPVVWTILYVLMGIGAARIWNKGTPARTSPLLLFGLQLLFNLFWSAWFFGAGAYLSAFLWLILLIVLILLMIRAFLAVDPLAGKLQLPYLCWCLFAAYLNFAVWFLNR